MSSTQLTNYGPVPIQSPPTGTPITVSKVTGRLDDLSADHHRHDFYMLYWTIEGTGHHLINYRSYEMKPGRLFFILEGQVHQVSNYAPEGWLILFDKMLYQNFIVQNGLEAQTGLFDHYSLAPFVDLEPGIIESFNTLAGLMENEKELPVIRHYLSILLLYANKQYSGRKEILFFHPKAVVVRKLKQLIEKYYKTQKLTSFYSSQLGLPARKINEITMQTMGKLTMELISDRVLAESETLLASTGLSIKNISYELGFLDQSHFATFFRKQKGMNPKAFRNRMKTINLS